MLAAPLGLSCPPPRKVQLSGELADLPSEPVLTRLALRPSRRPMQLASVSKVCEFLDPAIALWELLVQAAGIAFSFQLGSVGGLQFSRATEDAPLSWLY